MDLKIIWKWDWDTGLHILPTGRIFIMAFKILEHTYSDQRLGMIKPRSTANTKMELYLTTICISALASPICSNKFLCMPRLTQPCTCWSCKWTLILCLMLCVVILLTLDMNLSWSLWRQISTAMAHSTQIQTVSKCKEENTNPLGYMRAWKLAKTIIQSRAA